MDNGDWVRTAHEGSRGGMVGDGGDVVELSLEV